MHGKSIHQQGFSLLEILIAFSILALSLGILLNIFSGGLRRAMVAEEYQQAVIIAQSKLATVGVESALEEAVTQGQIMEKYTWSVHIQPFAMQGLEAEDLSLIPYLVTVTVEWDVGDNKRLVELTTLKLSSQS